MDAVILSRLQFAIATFFHFIFVPLTLGLSLFVALMETKYYRTGNTFYKDQAKFWGRIFLINFALGVVTGLTLEFQFGTNWARYSVYVGDIFGSLLAIEATAAFFLESTFIGVWMFGWNRISKGWHLASIWIVTLAGNFSALWIILANGFMQNPVGYTLVGEADKQKAQLASFWEVLTNPYGWHMFFHTVLGSIMLSGCLVMGVSAWRLFRKQNVSFFHASFKLALWFALICSLLLAFTGHKLGQVTAKYQPSKFAAMESVWETKESAPMYILTIPNMKGNGNMVESWPVPIDGFLSLLATGDANGKVIGLNDIPIDERPPVWPVFLSFRLMVALGGFFILLSIITFLIRNSIPKLRYLLLIYVLVIPLPYLALQLGWIVTEVGRQPWVVFGKLKTAVAVSSSVDWYQIAGTLMGMVILYSLLTILGIILMVKASLKDPHQEAGAY